MSSLTRDLLVSGARTELIETGTAAGQWTDDEIIQFLQESNERLTNMVELEANLTAQTTAQQEFVSYPATMGRILGIWLRRNGTNDNWIRLRSASKDERFPQASTSDAGKPEAYFIFAGKIFLLPTPDAVYDMNIFGNLAPSELRTAFGGSGTTTPIFDDEFHYLCRIYAVARCKQKVDDPGYANYDGQYAAGMRAMLEKQEFNRHEEGPRVPKLVSGVWD